MDQNIFQLIESINRGRCELESFEHVRRVQLNRAQSNGASPQLNELMEPLNITQFHVKITCRTAGEQSSATYVLSDYQWLRVKSLLPEVMGAEAAPQAEQKFRS